MLIGTEGITFEGSYTWGKEVKAPEGRRSDASRPLPYDCALEGRIIRKP